jgi:hypothetical protein
MGPSATSQSTSTSPSALELSPLFSSTAAYTRPSRRIRVRLALDSGAGTDEMLALSDDLVRSRI